MHNALWQLHAVSLCLLLAATDWQAFKKRDRVQVVLVHPHNAAVAPLHALIIATVVAAAAAAAASLGVSVVATVAAAAAADSITWR